MFLPFYRLLSDTSLMMVYLLFSVLKSLLKTVDLYVGGHGVRCLDFPGFSILFLDLGTCTIGINQQLFIT